MKKIPRTHIEGAMFYITSAGDNNSEIFKDEADRGFYIGLLNKYKAQYGFDLLAFRQMPDRVRLLLELKPGLTVSEIMHDITANYTKYFNAKYERKGHLFQERYKIVVAEKAQYLAPIKEYMAASCHARESGHPEQSGMDSRLRGNDNEDIFTKSGILGAGEFISRVNREIARQDAASRPKTRGKFAYVSGIIIALLLGVNFYAYGKAANVKMKTSRRVNEEKLKVEKELGRRYQAEMDLYYRDIAKKLQIEKQKAKVLQEKLSEEARRP